MKALPVKSHEPMRRFSLNKKYLRQCSKSQKNSHFSHETIYTYYKSREFPSMSTLSERRNMYRLFIQISSPRRQQKMLLSKTILTCLMSKKKAMINAQKDQRQATRRALLRTTHIDCGNGWCSQGQNPMTIWVGKNQRNRCLIFIKEKQGWILVNHMIKNFVYTTRISSRRWHRTDSCNVSMPSLIHVSGTANFKEGSIMRSVEKHGRSIIGYYMIDSVLSNDPESLDENLIKFRFLGTNQPPRDEDGRMLGNGDSQPKISLYGGQSFTYSWSRFFEFLDNITEAGVVDFIPYDEKKEAIEKALWHNGVRVVNDRDTQKSSHNCIRLTLSTQ